MSEAIELPNDYFDQFIDHEGYFRDKYENVYFSKPKIYNADGKTIAIAGWGTPGWASPVVFPYAHYISVTNLNGETFVYKISDLLVFLASEYNVTEFYNDPIAYIKVEMPDFLADSNKENEFWSNLKKLPSVK